MRIAIFCGFVLVVAIQVAQGSYITAASIAILFIINEVILERAFHALNQKYRSTIASLHEDNVILSKTLSRTQHALNDIRGDK